MSSVRNLATDFRKVRVSWQNLAVGMRIPIFYDRQNPNRQIALFAAYYEVALREDNRRKIALNR